MKPAVDSTTQRFTIHDYKRMAEDGQRYEVINGDQSKLLPGLRIAVNELLVD